MEVDISEKRYLVVHSASAPFSFVTKEIPNAFRADAFDVLTSTLISCGFFYNAYAGLVGYLKARHQRCPRNQNLMLLVNALQSFVCFCVGVLVLIHHCAPWIFECTVDLAACAIALSVSGGCVTAIMAAFAYQSAETTQGAHTLLAFGVFTVVATTVVDALAFKAMEMGITTFRNCTMTADSKTWIIGKLMVDLTTNLGLSLAYLNMLRKIVNDTGLPIYKVVFAHGLMGRFLVLASNLVCAILVASNAFEKWHVLIYSIDELLVSTILNWQLKTRHKALIKPLPDIASIDFAADHIAASPSTLTTSWHNANTTKLPYCCCYIASSQHVEACPAASVHS